MANEKSAVSLQAKPRSRVKHKPSVRDYEERRKRMIHNCEVAFGIISLCCIWYTFVSILTLVIS